MLRRKRSFTDDAYFDELSPKVMRSSPTIDIKKKERLASLSDTTCIWPMCANGFTKAPYRLIGRALFENGGDTTHHYLNIYSESSFEDVEQQLVTLLGPLARDLIFVIPINTGRGKMYSPIVVMKSSEIDYNRSKLVNAQYRYWVSNTSKLVSVISHDATVSVTSSNEIKITLQFSCQYDNLSFSKYLLHSHKSFIHFDLIFPVLSQLLMRPDAVLILERSPHSLYRACISIKSQINSSDALDTVIGNSRTCSSITEAWIRVENALAVHLNMQEKEFLPETRLLEQTFNRIVVVAELLSSSSVMELVMTPDPHLRTRTRSGEQQWSVSSSWEIGYGDTAHSQSVHSALERLDRGICVSDFIECTNNYYGPNHY
mmetsp:Transcript_1869/g.1950  ORF Transcript_1869/g.1950 Transcript_1869/m.1950 type:complete len:373 (-) Transcript_1869:14-1132(-)